MTKITKRLGIISFNIGIFTLPSAPVISIFFILISGLCSVNNDKKVFSKDIFNKIFSASAMLIILIATLQYFTTDIDSENVSFLEYIFISSINWVPFFVIFSTSQIYLETKKLRENFSSILLAGTVPVLVTVIGQGFWGWYGPMSTLFGKIVWYQRPTYEMAGLTGLFNNPNYLGAWLVSIVPFIIFLQLTKEKKSFKINILSIILLITVSTSVVLSSSRATWICSLLALPLVLGKQSIKHLISIAAASSLILISIFTEFFGKNLQIFTKSIIPEGIWHNFSSVGYESLDISRLYIWKHAIGMIIKNPFLGSGVNSYSKNLEALTGYWKGHAHNLPLEFMVSYGIPLGLLILLPILLITLISFKKILLDKNFISSNENIDKAWITSLVLLFLFHMADMPYFDCRISLISWLILSGSKIIITTKH